jgi:hypothetical protein
MQIDTFHRQESSEVKIEMESDEERSLTDQEWIRVANNQHKLRWLNGSGHAALPAVIPGSKRPLGGVQVKRDGDQITVVFPVEE